ncbi:MAG: eCIS core domain-containing protein [Cellulomonas sp.]
MSATRDAGGSRARTAAPTPRAERRAEEALSGPGRPLAPAFRSSMERRFGHDLADVRVHDSPRARAAAIGLGAGAFTLGRDVALGGDPTSDRSSLLAHELTHVVQQSDPQLAPGSGPTAEREASSAPAGADLPVVTGRPVGIACSAEDWLISTPSVQTWSVARLRAELSALEEWMVGHANEGVDSDRIFEARSIVAAELARNTGSGAMTPSPTAGAAAEAPAAAAETPVAPSPGVLGTIGGALLGEFEEDPTLGMIALDTGISLIPVVDQAADVRDVLAHLYWMIERGQHSRVMRWVGLTLSLIGAIPEIGTAIKGAAKTVIKGLREAMGHLDDILGITRRLLPEGGSLRRLLDFFREHWSQWSAFGTDLWNSVLERARSGLDAVWGALVPGRARLLAGIADVRRRSATMLSAAFARLLEMIDAGMERLLRAIEVDPAALRHLGDPALAAGGRLERGAFSAADDAGGGTLHMATTPERVTGGSAVVGGSGSTGTRATPDLTDAQRSGSLAPEIAAGVARAHVRPLGALLGAAFDTPGLQRLEQVWLRVTNPGEIASLTLGNSRRLFDNQRRRFWRAVADDPAAARLFSDAGMVFGRPGSAPLYVLANGGRVRATIDHVVERQSVPGRALDPTNLQLSLTRENTVLLRLINALDPFQGARVERRLAAHEAAVSEGIDDVVERWCDVPGP